MSDPRRHETHRMKNPLLPFILHDNHLKARIDQTNWHENPEFLLCLEGEGSLQYADRKIPFRAGDTLLINSNELHTVCAEEYVRYYCLIVDNSFFIQNGFDATKLCFQEYVRDPSLEQAYTETVTAIYTARREKTPLAVASARSSVLNLMLFLSLQYAHPSPLSVTSKASERVKAATLYIRDHFAGPMTLEEIAEAVGITKYHLSREFKAFTGQTVFEFINGTRCTEACHRIAMGMSLAQAAKECGFESLPYFSRTFKKKTGELPSKYAARHQKK